MTKSEQSFWLHFEINYESLLHLNVHQNNFVLKIEDDYKDLSNS